MAFNLYFAGSQIKGVNDYLIQKKCNRLYSQLNERSSISKYAELPNSDRPKLMIDSGAFSVAHAGKKVNIDDYIQFINDNDHYVEVWAELDVIPYPVLNYETARKCADASWENYLYMVDKVKSPEKLLPLYHFGEPYDHLKRILNTKIPVLGNKPAPYIGIGGRHGVSNKEHIEYFDTIFKLVRESSNPNVKIHVFGMTVLKMLESFPFYSADSTTWLQIGVNGGIATDFGIISISDRQSHHKKNISNYCNVSKETLESYVKSYGYDLNELAEDYKKRLMFNIDYYKKWAHNYQYKGTESTRKKLF